VGPNGGGLVVDHQKDAIVDPVGMKDEPLAIDDGVEPNPGAADYSVGDGDWLPPDDVVGDVVEPHLA